MEGKNGIIGNSTNFNSDTPSYGYNLWDKIPLIESHTQEGIDNLQKLSDFLKKRSLAEQKYAKELQSITESFRVVETKKKKKDDKTASTPLDAVTSTCQRAWDTLLDQTENLSRIHSQSCQYLENELAGSIKNYLKSYESDRKQRTNNVKTLKNDLRKVSENLAKVKKNYESACKEAVIAKSTAEKAKNDMNVTKAYEDKVREEAASKSKKAEDADEEYQRVLKETNDKQSQHYRNDLPLAVNQIQVLEETRVEFWKSILLKYSGYQISVIPDITQSMQKVTDSSNSIDKGQDSQLFIRQNDTKTPFPPAVPYENFWEKLSSKRRRKPEDEELDNLPADKAYKKAQAKLKDVIKELEDSENKRNGIETLAEAYLSQPELADTKALNGINVQLDEIESKIDVCRLRKYRYECIIATAEARDAPVMPGLYADSKAESTSNILKNQVLGSKSSVGFGMSSLSLGGDASNQNNSTHKSGSRNGSRFTLFGGGKSSSDTKGKFRVLYDFQASGESELSCNSGDFVTVAEKTDSGWVHVKDVHGKEGFVPQNYIEEVN